MYRVYICWRLDITRPIYVVLGLALKSIETVGMTVVLV